MDEKVPERIKDLVERFERNLSSYKNQGYNEAQLRQEFINPFFEALGWDVYNKSGAAPAYRDVIHEDSIKMAGGTKAPDYCFTLSGRRMFFVETKKPAVGIVSDSNPAYQLRRYAWSAKLPLSILTNFEDLCIYESRQKPHVGDKSNVERVKHIKFTEYIEKWGEIASIFSYNAVKQGSFDRFAQSMEKKRGTQEVGEEFLKEIEDWRENLAKNIALRNPNLGVRELNFCVQKTIDRIIFLRMCEDRGIESYGQLQSIAEKDCIYENLCKIFEKADAKYNSGLFHFRKEKQRNTLPDELTLSLSIDDAILKNIFRHLYYPNCPYEFSVLPPEILGNVYEQFLGKIIRLTEGHRAKVEEKPEVKKAGGVFYTPQYIVDYIVQNTVKKLCEGKTPKQIANLRILDPACGSGSFLLGAYSYLLQYHLDYYTEQKNTKRFKEEIYQSKDGQWFLTIKEKKRILLNNIYGVDIDNQAVEVTKLSLLLKVLEGTSKDIFEKQQKLWIERALPDLDNNIKCGNSLIGSDFYDNNQTKIVEDNNEIYRINAFDWNAEFNDIMKNGGFDAVIGNPPYIRIQAMQEWMPQAVKYFKEVYKAARSGNYDIYVVFVERGLSLLNADGRLGFILPSKFFATDYGEPLRQIITERKALSDIIDFSHAQVFEQATTYTCLLFLSKLSNKSVSYAKVLSPQTLTTNNISFKKFNINIFTSAPWTFATDIEKNIVNKIFRNSLPLKDLPTDIGRGSSSGADNIFILRKNGKSYTTVDGESVELELDILRLPISATDFGRYTFNYNSNNVIIFPYNVTENKYELISESVMQKDFPKTFNYLKNRRQELEKRKQFKTWYGFSAPRNLNVHDSAQILVPLLANKGSYCRLLTKIDRYCLMASGGFSITIKSKILSPNYVLGLLNSHLLFWRLHSISNIFRGGWITCTKQYVETLPIHLINFSDSAEKKRYEIMINLVDRMLALHEQFTKIKTAEEKTLIQRQIDITDQQINQLTYEMYGLNKEEIAIVEESLKN